MKERYLWGLVFIVSLGGAGVAAAAINCPEDRQNLSPNVVRVMTSDKDVSCTGALVGGGRFVLTAAHCLFEGGKDDRRLTQASKLSIFSGAQSQLNLGRVRVFRIHPSYRADFDYPDVAVLELEKPVKGGMEISSKAISAGNLKVQVGGYGVTKLHAVRSLDGKRRIGTGEIAKYDSKSICLRKAKIASGGTRVIPPDACVPAGQDSGSPIVQNGKILAVFTGDIETWEDDGSTLIEGCGVNLLNPEIQKFLTEALSTASGSTPSGADDFEGATSARAAD